MAIFDLLSYCQPSWMATITRKNKNGCHDFTFKDRDLLHKPNTTKFSQIFNLTMLSAIKDSNHYQKWKNVHNGNKNQLYLNFGQFLKSILWVMLNCSHYQEKINAIDTKKTCQIWQI